MTNDRVRPSVLGRVVASVLKLAPGWKPRAARFAVAAVVWFPLLSTVASGQATTPTIASVLPSPINISSSTAPVSISGSLLSSTCTPPSNSKTPPPPVVTIGGINVSSYIQTYNAGGISLAIPSSVLSDDSGQTVGVQVSVYILSGNPSLGETCNLVDSNSYSVAIGSSVTAPVVTSIAPTSATYCTPAFSMSLLGSNFQAGAAAVLGSDLNSPLDYTLLTVTSIAANQLSATVPSAAIPSVTAATTLSVWGGNPSPPSSNPPPGATYIVSQPLPFTVNPTPILQSVSPTSVVAGSGPFTLSTTIANYIHGVTKVEWPSLTAPGANSLPPQPLTLVAETAQATSGTYVVTWTVPANLIPTPAASATATVSVNVVNEDGANPNGTAYAASCSPQQMVIITNPVALQITTAAPLAQGEVSVAYSQGFTAIGGAPQYSWSMTPAVAGLTLNATTGVLSGTPTAAAAGTVTIQVTVKDSTGNTQAMSFPLTIDAALTVPPPYALPAGTINVPYSQTLTVTGGKAPYTWAVGSGSSAPDGLTLSAGGVLSGTPTKATSYSFSVLVTDALGGFSGPALSLTINPATPTLTITTATLPVATVGSAYSQQLGASGGAPAYTWTTPGPLPSGIQLSGGGLLSGTPTVAGSFPFTVTLTDSAKATKTQSYTLTVGVPAAPPVTIQPSQTQSSSITDQPTVSATLGSSYPLPLTGTLTLSFKPSASSLPATYTPPDLQFASGGLTATVKIPAGTTAVNLPANEGIQLGSVAGIVTVSMTALVATLPGGGTQALALPTPAPIATITIQAEKPVITGSVALNNKTSTGFTLEVTEAVSNTRDLVSATLTFNAAAGATLTGTTSFTVPLNSGATPISTPWFTSAQGQAAGGTFDLQIPFTFSGNPSAIGSVSVVLTNSAGASTPATGQ